MPDILTRYRRVAEAGKDMQLNGRFIQFRSTISGVNTNRTARLNALSYMPQSVQCGRPRAGGFTGSRQTVLNLGSFSMFASRGEHRQSEWGGPSGI
jgi:hypothetical protein